MNHIAARAAAAAALLLCTGCIAPSSYDGAKEAAPASSPATQANEQANGGTAPAGNSPERGSTGDKSAPAQATPKTSVDEVSKSSQDGSRQPLDPKLIAESCTNEGTYRMELNSSVATPEIPKIDGKTLTLTYTGSSQGTGNSAVAHFDASIDGMAAQEIAAPLGDLASVGPWTFTPTSICADNVEFDVVNR
ncbi:hypothetical protein KRX56_00350 [Dermabacteraceae bacterium TAE3-ERU27]|nr:hypothetical protein [Dermabacteraceae bacterium TAE3-ERU27]